ncbi:Zinc Finger Protein 14 [Manis pentadactyla]|nr:Zinc Finger Protein 14 [Manis pentadactyla]
MAVDFFELMPFCPKTGKMLDKIEIGFTLEEAYLRTLQRKLSNEIVIWENVERKNLKSHVCRAEPWMA